MPPPHGTRTRYINHDRCRCPACCRANTAYQRARRTEPSRLVDVVPVRAHLRRLSAAGIGSRQVEIISGVKRSVVQSCKCGRTRKMQRRFAEAILAIAVDDHVADRALVDAAESHRLLVDLHRLGLSNADVARGLRYRNEKLSQSRRRRITHRNARRIRVFHDAAIRELVGSRVADDETVVYRIPSDTVQCPQ